MDRKQLRWSLLKLSLVLLAASSWVFLSFMLKTRPEESSAPALVALARLPASLPKQLPQGLPNVFASGATKPMDPIEMTSVNVKCWNQAEKTKLKTNARWVRITGQNCADWNEATKPITVVNSTNGYSATVFEGTGESTGLTTDYIPLESGRNEIHIQVSNAVGVSESHVLELVK